MFCHVLYTGPYTTDRFIDYLSIEMEHENCSFCITFYDKMEGRLVWATKDYGLCTNSCFRQELAINGTSSCCWCARKIVEAFSHETVQGQCCSQKCLAWSIKSVADKVQESSPDTKAGG